jgi:hypothetical protein
MKQNLSWVISENIRKALLQMTISLFVKHSKLLFSLLILVPYLPSEIQNSVQPGKETSGHMEVTPSLFSSHLFLFFFFTFLFFFLVFFFSVSFHCRWNMCLYILVWTPCLMHRWKENNICQSIWDKSEVLICRTCWGTHCELGEHIGNPLRT